MIVWSGLVPLFPPPSEILPRPSKYHQWLAVKGAGEAPKIGVRATVWRAAALRLESDTSTAQSMNHLITGGVTRSGLDALSSRPEQIRSIGGLGCALRQVVVAAYRDQKCLLSLIYGTLKTSINNGGALLEYANFCTRFMIIGDEAPRWHWLGLVRVSGVCETMCRCKDKADNISKKGEHRNQAVLFASWI
jgi:hypothetical protein